MLIKQVTRKGEPVLYTPKESLPFAVEYGVKKKSTQERVYWVLKDSITEKQTQVIQSGKEWEAVAEGSAKIGYTDSKTDRFYEAKPHTYKVRFKPKRDDLGLPDIEVVSFEMSPVNQNPAALMNFQDKTLPPSEE